MRSLAAVFALLTALLVAACDPTPRVFASRASDPLAAVPAAAGVMIAPLQGLPEPVADELRQAVAAALQSQGIPATTTSAGRTRATLTGQVDAATAGTDGPAFIAWTLTGADGNELSAFTGTAQLTPGRVRQDNGGALSNIVRQVNEALAGAGRRPRQRRTAASTDTPVISVLPVEGAPSDGRDVLADALRQALRARGLRLADSLDAEGLIVFGDVLVEPAGGAQEKVSITWQVRWADGRELGVVSQANTVPRGATAATWSPVAGVVANNAADGIARLVRQGLPATPTEAPSR